MIAKGTTQETVEVAAGEVTQNTKAEREKLVQRTPAKVRTPEESVARCMKVLKTRVLGKQARKSERNTWWNIWSYAARHLERGKYEESHCQNCMHPKLDRPTSTWKTEGYLKVGFFGQKSEEGTPKKASSRPKVRREEGHPLLLAPKSKRRKGTSR